MSSGNYVFILEPVNTDLTPRPWPRINRATDVCRIKPGYAPVLITCIETALGDCLQTGDDSPIEFE